jgi:hypothetical protein
LRGENMAIDGSAKVAGSVLTVVKLLFSLLGVEIIDILYTLDSASNYSAIQKLKP